MSKPKVNKIVNDIYEQNKATITGKTPPKQLKKKKNKK